MNKLHISILSIIMCGILTVSTTSCSLKNGSPDCTYEYILNNQVNYEKYIFVGDSRFVGMEAAIKESIDADVKIVAKTGQGLDWFKTVAPDLYDETGKTIVFNLGVNDLYNESAYVDFYNNMPQGFIENNTLVIMTVNPVDEQKEAECGYGIKDSNIVKFNDDLVKDINGEYFKIIDSYTFMKNSSFKTVDGLHFTNDTYMMIFDHAIECCEKQDFMKR